MIRIEITTDEEQQGYKTLATAIKSCMEVHGIQVQADGLEDGEAKGLVEKLEQYLPAVARKLGSPRISPGTPQQESSPEETFTTDAPDLEVERRLDELKRKNQELRAQLDLVSEFDVSTSIETKILPGYLVVRVMGFKDAKWSIANAAGWRWNKVTKEWTPARGSQHKTDEHLFDNAHEALNEARKIYREALDRKEKRV